MKWGLTAFCALALVCCVSDDSGLPDGGGNDSSVETGADVTVQDGPSEGAVSDGAADGAADVEADAPRPVPKPVGDFDWSMGTDGNGNGPVAYDSQGNLFYAWQTYYATTFNNTAYNPAGSWDAMLAKFDPSGKVLWAKQIAGSGSDQVLALATDPAGDVYATVLTASPTISFGNNVTYNRVGSNGDGLLVKLNGKDGSGLWLADYTPASDSWLQCGQLAYGGGRLGIACWSYGGMALTKDSDGTALTLSCLECGGSNPQYNDIYVASIDPTNGHAYWGNVIAADSQTTAASLAVDSKGAVILDFTSFGTIVHDPTNSVNWTYKGTAGAEILVLKLATTNGAATWFKQFPDGTTSGNGPVAPGQLAVDSNDDVVLGGRLWGQVAFGTVTLKSASSNYDGLVAKLKGGFGDVIWAQSFGGTAADGTASVGVDAWNEVFVANECSSTDAKLGTMSFPAASGHQAICIGKLDPNGTALWATGIVSSSNDLGLWPNAAVAVDPSVGDVTVSGGFQGTANLGDGNPLTSKSAEEIEFVVTHNP